MCGREGGGQKERENGDKKEGRERIGGGEMFVSGRLKAGGASAWGACGDPALLWGGKHAKWAKCLKSL